MDQRGGMMNDVFAMGARQLSNGVCRDIEMVDVLKDNIR